MEGFGQFGQIAFVFSVEGIVTLKFAFSATLDIVPRSLFRARYHSLLRLKDAYSKRISPEFGCLELCGDEYIFTVQAGRPTPASA